MPEHRVPKSRVVVYEVVFLFVRTLANGTRSFGV